jgi:hypothetical protein
MTLMPQEPTNKTTAASVAVSCLEEADGDWSMAAELMRKRIEEDADLRSEILKPLIDGAIWTLIRNAAHRTRTSWKPSEEAEAAHGESVARIRRVAASLYDWPLPGGIKLGRATAQTLEEAISIYESNEKRNGARKAWLREIKSKVKGDKTVAECLTEAQIERLRIKHGA